MSLLIHRKKRLYNPLIICESEKKNTKHKLVGFVKEDSDSMPKTIFECLSCKDRRVYGNAELGPRLATLYQDTSYLN